MNLEKARRLVTQFEECTLPKEEWTHTAHFIMAFWYCIQYPLPRAVQKIRQGIQAYNVSVGGANTDTSGYHETITLFYTNLIAGYLVTAGVTALTDETIGIFLQQPFLEKNYVFEFYSNDVLLSKKARRHWVPPSNPDIFVSKTNSGGHASYITS